MKEIMITKKKIEESLLGDTTAYLNELLDTIEDDTYIRFEKDVYEFRCRYAKEEYCYITNNDHSLKKIAFLVKGKKNIVIDGNGSTFVMVGRIMPMILQQSKNIILKNFHIDYKRPFFTQGHILEATDTYVKLSVDKDEFPYEVKGGVICFTGDDYEETYIHDLLEYDAAVKRPGYKSVDYFKDAAIQAEEIEEGVIKLKYNFNQKLKVGNILTIKHERRLIPGIVLDHSEEILIKQVHIKQAGSMAIIAQFCENVTLEAVKVAPDESSKRVVSANADATHFVGCKGMVKVENCVFESQLDDAFNVHGNYLILEKVVSSNQVIAKIGHVQQVGIFGLEPGGKIEILNQETMLCDQYAILKSKKVLNNKFVLLTFEDDVNLDEKKSYCLDDCDSYPSVIFRKNIVRYNRARGLLLTTKKPILVEDNLFDTEGAAIKISGDMNYWFESCGTAHVMIRNNKISTTCNYNWGLGVIDIDPEMEIQIEGKYYHKTIHIENNRIETKGRPLIYAKSVQEIILKNNEIVGIDKPIFNIENVGSLLY